MEEIVEMSAVFEQKNVGDEISQVERLLNEFEAHEGKEEKAIEHYRKALEYAQNPVTRFLLQMIISDEEKHRAVTHAMASTLRGSLTWTKPEGNLDDSANCGTNNQQLLAVTEEFLDLEKAGVKEYKALLKESAGYYYGLFEVLLRAMIHDSEKHIELLEYLRQRLRQA